MARSTLLAVFFSPFSHLEMHLQDIEEGAIGMIGILHSTEAHRHEHGDALLVHLKGGLLLGIELREGRVNVGIIHVAEQPIKGDIRRWGERSSETRYLGDNEEHVYPCPGC